MFVSFVGVRAFLNVWHTTNSRKQFRVFLGTEPSTTDFSSDSLHTIKYSYVSARPSAKTKHQRQFDKKEQLVQSKLTIWNNYIFSIMLRFWYWWSIVNGPLRQKLVRELTYQVKTKTKIIRIDNSQSGVIMRAMIKLLRLSFLLCIQSAVRGRYKKKRNFIESYCIINNNCLNKCHFVHSCPFFWPLSQTFHWGVTYAYGEPLRETILHQPTYISYPKAKYCQLQREHIFPAPIACCGALNT